MKFHDAEVISIEVDRLQHIARLKLRQVDGNLFSIELVNLKIFRAEDITLQNVVYELFRYSQGEFSRDKAKYWLEWGTSLSDRGSSLKEEWKEKYLSACANSELELVVIMPSAGAQIMALCEKVAVGIVSA